MAEMLLIGDVKNRHKSKKLYHCLKSVIGSVRDFHTLSDQQQNDPSITTKEQTAVTATERRGCWLKYI